MLRGERRPSQINYLEPKPEPVHYPAPPEEMDEVAQEVWRTTYAALEPAGVITSADLELLRLYSEAVARYRQAAALYTRLGAMVRGQKGEMVKNPLHQVVRDNADLVKALSRELGLTPSSRASLRSGSEGGSSAAGARLDALLAAKRR
jgi:P27 family predicted phage terminase small subunit